MLFLKFQALQKLPIPLPCPKCQEKQSRIFVACVLRSVDTVSSCISARVLTHKELTRYASLAMEETRHCLIQKTPGFIYAYVYTNTHLPM